MALTFEQNKKLIHWIEAGAPRGSGGDTLALTKSRAPEWPAGSRKPFGALSPQPLHSTGALPSIYGNSTAPGQAAVARRPVLKSVVTHSTPGGASAGRGCCGSARITCAKIGKAPLPPVSLVG